MRRFLVAALLVGMIGLGYAFWPMPRDPGPLENDIRYPVPSFRLTERSGTTISPETLKGNVWIASFVFTRCNGPCPAVTATVAQLQAHYASEPQVKFVTFTVDPERDTPDELKKYAERYRADPERWLFLTGPEAMIHALMMDGFKVAAGKKSNPQPGDEFDHSTKLAIVDKAGIIRGYCDGMAPAGREGGAEQFAAGLERLKVLVAKLLKE